MDFYKHLNYSLGNEDWRVESQALRVNPGDRVVCVTASGDRPLHLLMTDCAEIISIDMNKLQNHLLELKMAAIANLDYEKYMAFLGFGPCNDRYAIFKELKPHLSEKAITLWESRKKLLHTGIIYQGRVERLTRLVAKIFNVFRGSKIKTLLSFYNLDEQREFVAKEWDTKLLRKTFEVLINPKLSQFLIRDPGLNSYVDFAKKPGLYIYERMINYLNTYLARNSPLLQLILIGKILPDAYFPYLTFDGYSKINRSLGRVHIIDGNIIEYLQQSEPNKIDCFSLSDIASYMPQVVFENLLTGVKNAAKHNSRFCMREFISKRIIPKNFEPTYQRNAILEKKLEMEESNFVYRFIVGEVQKIS